jgi:hypothetical protein
MLHKPGPHAPPAHRHAPQRVVRLGLARHMSLLIGKERNGYAVSRY